LDEGVQAYIDAIDRERRPLFERLHALVLEAHPDAEVALSYHMPAYRLGARRPNLGAWKHGVSVYGFRKDNDGGFLARHPELSSGKGTIRIRLPDAEVISDDDFRGLLGGRWSLAGVRRNGLRPPRRRGRAPAVREPTGGRRAEARGKEEKSGEGRRVSRAR
jgi:Domain of unknown function (DU1801)